MNNCPMREWLDAPCAAIDFPELDSCERCPHAILLWLYEEQKVKLGEAEKNRDENGEALDTINEMLEARARSLTQAEAQRDKALELLGKHQWSGRDIDGYLVCPECGQIEEVGHAPDCELAKALEEQP